jgi:hypothetical protein
VRIAAKRVNGPAELLLLRFGITAHALDRYGRRRRSPKPHRKTAPPLGARDCSVLILHQRYEYVREGGDRKSPIVIAGLQEYSPAQRREKVTVWRFDVPAGVAADLPSGLKVDTWKDVIHTLKRYFSSETDEGLRERLQSR